MREQIYLNEIIVVELTTQFSDAGSEKRKAVLHFL